MEIIKFFKTHVNFRQKNFKPCESVTTKIYEQNNREALAKYLNINQKIQKNVGSYKGLNQNIQYLEAAITTHCSFLKLEQIESQYRSHKQQDFYNFVTETVEQNLDQEIFCSTLKRKLAEILPLVNSEEGRTALRTYIKETIKVSENSLGLEMFSVFKQIKSTKLKLLAKVSTIVNKLKPEDLVDMDNLIVIVLENYHAFENLAPIINIQEDQILPKNFAIILQYIGLSRIYQNSTENSSELNNYLNSEYEFNNSNRSIKQVPKKSLLLHNRRIRQLLNLSKKVEKIAYEQFSSEESMLYVQISHKLKKGAEEYQGINQSIEYLEVAIATQSSFLKLEQTESRYRSRKQQEFYNVVAETITKNLDKDVFRNTLKRKLAEIVPLLNSEEGRKALQSYIKEITKISEHNLGLKLFSLFKQHKVTNFTILAKVADIVSKIQAEDLLSKNNLVVLVLENYDVFENLAPIINIPEERISPETFAIILQYMSLVRRQGNAMEDFERLSTSLKQWHKPYKSLLTIRQQYPEAEYRLPQEFEDKIPGLQIFKKYEPYIFDE